MKAIELRINNWIKDGNDFEQITIDHLSCLNSGRCEFEPIQLTEEWLLRFGFVKEVLGFKHWNLDLYFHLDGEFFESDQLPMFIFLEHVHQLQNLYFALTGKELLLSLP